MKEGRCKNCGSIIFLDPKNEQCHCLFCDCVFDTEEALRIKADPEGYEFPNEPQPKYEGPSLTPGTHGSPVKFRATPAKAKSVSTEPAYQISKKNLPKLNLGIKQKAVILGSFLAVIAVFMAVMVPLILSRDRSRAEITERFSQNLVSEGVVKEVKSGENLDIKRMNNSFALVIVDQIESKDQVKKLFEAFCHARRDVLELSDTDEDKVYEAVTLQIATPKQGGYLVKNAKLSDLANSDTIQVLP